MTPAPLALALLAAALLGTSAALQRQALAGPAAHDLVRTGLLRRAARRPLWWAGVACSAGALVAQFTALRLGSLLVVQVVLLLGIVVSGLVEQVAFGARPRPRARTGMLLTTAGLVAVLVGPAAVALSHAPPTGAVGVSR